MRSRFHLALILTLVLAAAAAVAPTAQAAPVARAALVVGNAAYPDADEVLKTPTSDADSVARALTQKSFVVDTVKNATRKQLDAAVSQLLDRIGPGTDVVLFFAGYAIQVQRRNYLVPVDARIWSEADVQRDGLSIDAILADASRKGAQTRIVILDASRRNPFERRFRGLSAGLAAAAPRTGVITLSSAAAGSVINDAGSQNSPFVSELLSQISVPTLSAEQAFEACRNNIVRASQNAQTPAVVSDLEKPFYFDPARKPPETKVVAEPVPDAPAAVEPKAPPASPPVVTQAERPPAAPPPVVPQDKPIVSRLEPPIASPPPGVRPMAPDAAPPPRLAPPAPAGGTVPSPNPATQNAPSTDVPVRPLQPAAAPPAPAPLPNRPTAAPVAPPRPYTAEESARRSGLDAVIARNSRDSLAITERGELLAQHGEFDLAYADFDRAARLDPKNVEALNNRCWVHAIRNELQAALADCNEALRVRHDFADAYDSRGMVFLKIDQPRAALADYDAALKIDPSHSSALYGRGIANFRLGNKIQADKDFAGALALNGTVDRDYARYGLN